ncbi:DNA repair protein RecO C-terminal domain-containing protein [uncultured Proteiniphilum sp.]|uniref:DNA repair protein RecO n=1 Tax=uncultured Proteiniphilum sp. TaxID=497637 RepID=UPI00262D9E0B|nr:DNA repair protein RecO C-terminal domain-containing protein [uncultured Proteiniphilum sp.]
MLHKTEGIVLGTTSYSDAYSIAHLFTRDFGRVSYLLPMSRGKKPKIRTSLFFPLSVLHMEVEHMPLREVQKLKDAERQFPLYELCTNMTKVSLAFFISEFLSFILRESGHNELAFDYLKNSVETLEAAEKGLANFHLALMMGLTRFLGIYPNTEFAGEHSFFDLQNGEFVVNEPRHSYYLNRRESSYLRDLYRIHYGNMHLFRLSRNNRNVIVDQLLDYYRLHVCNFPPLKSLEVLREMV